MIPPLSPVQLPLIPTKGPSSTRHWQIKGLSGSEGFWIFRAGSAVADRPIVIPGISIVCLITRYRLHRQKTAPPSVRKRRDPVILDMIHLILPVPDGLADWSLIHIARMFIGALGQRQAFDRRILDVTGQDNMGFIHPHTVAVGHVAVHLAVEGCATQGVPSGTHDKFLRHVIFMGVPGLGVGDIEMSYRKEYEQSEC